MVPRCGRSEGVHGDRGCRSVEASDRNYPTEMLVGGGREKGEASWGHNAALGEAADGFIGLNLEF